MSAPRITLLRSQHDKLLEHFKSASEGHERAAVVLFRRYRFASTEAESERFVAIDIIPLHAPCITSSSSTHISFNLQPLRELFQRCEEEKLVFGFVHNHPTGYTGFSDVDDENERTLLTAISNRNGLDISFIGMIWTQQKWIARARYAKNIDSFKPIKHVSVIGERIELHLGVSDIQDFGEILKKQEAAFGAPFVKKLSSLRIAIVGAGGTGSALATLLARCGASDLILIDHDCLEERNLNRVRGSRKKDIGFPKVQIIKSFIDSLEFPVSVSTITQKVDESHQAIDSLATCDVVFGCTDDQIGRELLTAASSRYAFVYIDIGLGGSIKTDADGYPILRNHSARVSTIFPEFGDCLFCQHVISQREIQTEYARREKPTITDGELEERYLVGGAEQAPGIAPFTGAAADFAVAALFDLIRPFRRLPDTIRKDLLMINFVNLELHSCQHFSNPNCSYCGTREMLLKKESYRLDRPFLGKRNETC